MIRSLGPDVQATMMHARLDDPGERHRLVARAWDVGTLDMSYRTFVSQWAEADPVLPGDAFVQRMHLAYEWRLLMLADPGLPPALLPPDWSGERARLPMLDRHAGWRPLATRWWDTREAAPRGAKAPVSGANSS